MSAALRGRARRWPPPAAAALAVIAALATTTASRRARAAGPAADPDPWFGRDKALHFGVSAALAGGAYGVSAFALEPRWQRAAVGATFSLAVGAAKETYDLMGYGDPSWKDFTWDVIGTAVGVGVALLVDWAVRGGRTGDAGGGGNVAPPRTSTSPFVVRF